MSIQIQRVSQAYGRYPDGTFQDFLDGVKLKFYGNTNFPDPPVSEEEFTAANEAFREAKAETVQGGTAATANKNNKRDELYAVSKLIAVYVTEVSDNNLAVLLTSGFEAISTNRSSEELSVPVDLNARFGNPGSVLLTIKAVKNARSYESSYALIDENGNIGEWMAGPPSTSSRNMNIGGLISGQMYRFRVRAVGGSTGVSAWSNPTSQRAY